jgi:asparagine synthase (glutamine-hydrolysing)
MCGIAGFMRARADLHADVLAERATRMADAIAHRGPDDRGAWTDSSAGVALAHRRLSVIDLSGEGHQPMVSATGRYLLVYNGEVYNYADVRRELEGAGAAPRWRGHSDTEAMLAAFEKWGIDGALARFNGMFAFALWDRLERTLHFARDRMGEKPLYYGSAQETFAFGSELKALRALPDFATEIDQDALALFLRFNCVPAPWSIYRGIRKLEPGMRAEVRADGHGGFDIRLLRYWDVTAVARSGMAHADGTDALERLQSALEQAVRLRLVADVPVGAFLSGGIDSSIVTALMQRQCASPVHTFTIGFRNDAYDEAPFARQVARHLGTDHTELYVSGDEARAVVPLLPAMYDEPFADSSQIPTYLVSRLARTQVTVALSGDGGDELFFGYERYVRGLQLARAPRAMRRATAGALAFVTPAIADRLLCRAQAFLPRRLRFAHPGEKLRKLRRALNEADPRARYLDLVSFWHDGVPTASSHAVTAPHDRFVDADRDLPFADWMMLVDQRTYLPDDILTKVDRASMAVALEARVPLLDHELLAFAWSLPFDAKSSRGRGKHLLRELLCRYVPRELVERPKRGFAVPLGDWLRGPMREWADALLDETRLRREGFLDPAPIRARWRQHLAGVDSAESELWSVLTFQAWLEATHAR